MAVHREHSRVQTNASSPSPPYFTIRSHSCRSPEKSPLCHADVIEMLFPMRCPASTRGLRRSEPSKVSYRSAPSVIHSLHTRSTSVTYDRANAFHRMPRLLRGTARAVPRSFLGNDLRPPQGLPVLLLPNVMLSVHDRWKAKPALHTCRAVRALSDDESPGLPDAIRKR